MPTKTATQDEQDWTLLPGIAELARSLRQTTRQRDDLLAALEELIDEWRNPERVTGVIPLETWKQAILAAQAAGSKIAYHVKAEA